MKPHSILVALCILPLHQGTSAPEATVPLEHLPATVDFSRTFQTWDGFGFNYVESCQHRDYPVNPQDYGGFSLLNERQKEEIIDLVFAEDGLDVDIVKMFLDPWHQEEPGGAFDHESSTANMLEFVEGGVAKKAPRGEELEVISTLYGPPAWATRQQFIGGRDLDHSMFEPLADYMVAWAAFLQGRGIPIKHLSIHNEGEDFYRWDFNDGTQRLPGFDYNAYWRPDEVNDFVLLLNHRLKQQGLGHIGVTNGEPSNWTRFYNWGYAWPLYENEEALNALSILTTHGFINGDFNRLSYSQVNSKTTDLLRSKRPDLHAWVTSFSWGEMDTRFVKMMYEHIYVAGVNALIPWAGIQVPSRWINGDPNPGTAILVGEDGSYEVTTGYYIYKQMTQAGRRGMAIAHTMTANPVSRLIAFAGNETGHPDAFVLESNIFIWKLPFRIEVKGSEYSHFKAYRTLVDGSEKFKAIGIFKVENGGIVYDAPRGSVTTFIGIQ